MTNCNYSEHTKIQRKEMQKQIEELQEKLRKLEEQEPEMLLLRQGKVDIVDYNHRTHYRIEYTDSFSGAYKWFVRKLGEIPFLEEIRDVNVYSPLEELYQKEVMKQKEEYPYKKYTPEETEQSLKEAFREAVKQGVVSSVDKPKTLTDLIYRWWGDVFTTHSDWDMETSIEDLVDQIELFLPREQSAEGSQNAYVECTVEGFNDAIKKIKGKLR